MKVDIDFKTIQAFLEAKFSNLKNSIVLLTSMSENNTILGKNAIVVLSNTRGVSSMIRAIVEQPSVKVISENSKGYAVVLVTIKRSNNSLSSDDASLVIEKDEKHSLEEFFEYDKPGCWHQ